MRIVIDGNIGSGKTTQLNLLEQKGWKVQREPIDEWPLELFYSDKSRWALLLQLKILQTIRPSEGTVVYERCLLSTRHVFWEYLLQNRLVREEEDDVYRRQYRKDAWYPDVYIFLSKEPETAYRHIQTRCQAGDSEISLEYLKDLDVLYKELLLKIPCAHYIIDANKSPEEIHSEILSLLTLDGKVHIDDDDKSKMQTTISHRWKMLRTSFSRLCNLHGTSS